MKQIVLLSTAIFLNLLTVSGQSSHKSKIIKPINHSSKVIIEVSGHKSEYFELSQNQPSIIQITGPGTLKVITRVNFLPTHGPKLNYKIQYIIDDTQPQIVKISESSRSETARYLSDEEGIPGQSKPIEIPVSRGTHTIEFRSLEPLLSLYARYIFTPGKEKKTDWISYSPLPPLEPVELLTHEETVKYYRFSAENPLRIEITGPSELKIFTRAEHNYKMKGRIDYRVQVKRNNEIIHTFQLGNVPSEVTMYRDNKDLIPGKACEFSIIVPKGSHLYEIIPLDEDKSTLLGRILIPVSSINP